MVTPLARELERLAPALAGDDGATPEYPWPRPFPIETPATYDLAIWHRLTERGRGRQLVKVVDEAVVQSPRYA